MAVKILSINCQYIDNRFKNCYYILADRNMLYTRSTELTFKRHVMSSDAGPPFGGFFTIREKHGFVCYLNL
nr:MAG TPA: hypothetical protein [Caudoviricetes sp.]